MTDKLKSLQPKVEKLLVGNRPEKTIEIKVYPLSMADQMEFAELLSEGIKPLVESDAGDADFMNFLMNFFKENLPTMLKYVVDEDPKMIIQHITNDQLVRAAEIIYEVNFESAVKNVKSLLERAGVQSPSRRQFQPSAKTMDTGLNISTKKVTEKEE